jgi:ATP-binding cassette, subfamily B (MDR/TAP), member 1
VTFGSIQAGGIFAFVPDISKSHIAGSEIITLLDAKPDIDAQSKEGKVPQDVKGRVEIKDVHFRYPTRPAVRVLRNFNLTVEPGTHVALVGPSGCGKSTIIQLIERFYDPLSGSVNVSESRLTKNLMAELFVG